MKVLVTGGAGFIGSALVEKLVAQGHTVSALDDLSFGRAEHLDGMDVTLHTVDIRDAVAVEAAVRAEAPDAVMHLAAIHFIPYCNQHPYEATDINVRGTMNVLDACQAAGVGNVFFASTAAVYPIADEPHQETDTPGPSDVYGLSKLIGERLCSEFHLKTGAKVSVGRFFNAFGPNETNPHLIPEIVGQVADGARDVNLGNLDPKRDFIHTSDIADAVILLTLGEGSGLRTVNIGSGEEWSVREVIETIERHLGDSIRIHVDPARVRKVERMHLRADTRRLRALGWAPQVSFDAGMADLVARCVQRP